MKHPLHDFARPAVAALLIAASAGCSGLGFLPGVGDRGERPLAPAEAVDQLSSTRAKMTLAPNEPYWAFRMGELYAAADSTMLAVKHLNDALTLDPSYAPAAALLSKIYYDAGMYAQGVDLLDAFIARNAQAPDELRVALALHADAAGETARAQTVLSGCRTSSDDARAARAYVTLRGQNPKSAIAAAKEALDANDASAANHNNYGIALLHAGRPVEAREHFKTALSIDDKLPGALYNMAIVDAFYFFDEAAGREWFARYKKVANDDPDDLAARLGPKVTASGGAPKQP